MTTESAAAEPLRDRKVMAELALVGECVAAMKAAAAVPVTVKCRIGDARKCIADHRGSPELRTSCWRWPTSPGSAGSRPSAPGPCRLPGGRCPPPPLRGDYRTGRANDSEG